MRPSSPDLARAFADGVAAHGLDVDPDRAVLDRRPLLRQRRARRARRDVHRQPQPRAVQRDQAVPRRRARPVGQDSGLAEVRDLAQQLLDTGAAALAGEARGPARSPSGTCSATTRRSCAGWSTCPASARSRWSSTPATAWAASPPRPSSARRPACPAAAGRRTAVLRAGRHVPQPRGQPARAGEPARPAARPSSSTAPTSGWPSTATPTAASSSTSAVTRSAPARSPRWSPPARSPGAGRGPTAADGP